LPTFEEIEESIRDRVGRDFSQEVDLVNLGLTLAWEGARLADGMIPQYWERAYWRLIVSCLNSVRMALDVLARGYPIQAQTLTRGAFEAATAAAYVRKNKRAARFWLAKKYMLGVGQRRRSHQGLYDRRVPSPEKILEDLRGAKGFSERYALLSLYGHPRGAGLLATMGPDADGKSELAFGGHFRPTDISVAFYNLIPVAALLLGLLLGSRHQASPLWEQRAKDYLRACSEWERSFRVRS
jgi:hypothetical protein